MADRTGKPDLEKDYTVAAILVIVVGGMAALMGYLAISYYLATRNRPLQPKKKIGAKKAKREKLKMGLRPAGDD